VIYAYKLMATKLCNYFLNITVPSVKAMIVNYKKQAKLCISLHLTELHVIFRMFFYLLSALDTDFVIDTVM